MPAEKTEVRGLMDTNLAAFLDAAAMARKMDLNSLINRICDKWAREEAHRANVIQRTCRDNPLLSESNGSTTDWGDLS